jgi:hypothetical protein
MSGDRTVFWDGGASVADRIQALLLDAVTLGTHGSVNANGQTYYYLGLEQ